MKGTYEYKLGYSNGYNAGRKERPIPPVTTEIPAHVKRHDALMVEALKLTLSECNGWSVRGEKIKGAEGFADLAKIFVDNIIRKGPTQ